MNILQGAYDLHIHPSSDIRERKLDEIELAERFIERGYAGFAIKCHYQDTACRASQLQKQFPKLNIVGGITLNKYAGGLNPYAVEVSAKFGGRYIWMPTMDGFYYQQFKATLPETHVNSLISILDDQGRVKSEVHEIIEVAKANNMIIGTGHLSAAEGIALAKVARQKEYEKLVLTHADNPANRYSISELQQCVELGATVEISYFTLAKELTPIEMIVEIIENIGKDNIMLTTDLGQPELSFPDDAMEEFLQSLSEHNISKSALIDMTRNKAMYLLG